MGNITQQIKDLMSDKQEKSVFIAYILCFAGFLGPCGLHNFYLQKNTKGIAFLCTYGFFGIGQLIDLCRLENDVEIYNETHFPKKRNMDTNRQKKNQQNSNTIVINVNTK